MGFIWLYCQLVNGKRASGLWTVRIAACVTPVLLHPCSEFIFARECLFANEWLASHSYPPWGDGAGDPVIYSRSRQRKVCDTVAVALGDEKIWVADARSTLGPWVENNKQRAEKQDSAHQTTIDCMTGNVTPQSRLHTRRLPHLWICAGVHVTVHACMNMQGISVCFLYFSCVETTVLSNTG